jgi:hypothetical protein
LPAAFPILSKTGRGIGTEDSDEEFGQQDTSPTERRSAYDGLGLGRPSVIKTAGTGWLLRRSSSGAISHATSGSGNMSGDGSPTGAGSATHRTSQLALLFHLTHELTDAQVGSFHPHVFHPGFPHSSRASRTTSH